MAFTSTLFIPGHENRMLFNSVMDAGSRIFRALFPKNRFIADAVMAIIRVSSAVDDASFNAMVKTHKKSLEGRRELVENDIERGRLEKKIVILDQWVTESSK